MSEDLFPIRRAMAVGAHPDDNEFGCFGTLARMVDEGVECTLVIVTNGNAGGEGDRTHAELAKVRVEEQVEAARIIGIPRQRIVNLGYDDGHVTPSLNLRRDLARVIRQFRPDLVISHNAVRNYGFIGSNHPDHLAVGEATLAAIYPTARNPMAFPELLEKEGLDKWVVNWVYITGSTLEKPNHWVDIAATVDRKIAALLAHHSQLPPETGDWARQMAVDSAIRGKKHGGVDFEYAEEFLKLFTGELRSEGGRELVARERERARNSATP
ncbi:MAG: PIG-L deacetylase family protein [Candidatus Dormibacteria bacterium]